MHTMLLTQPQATLFKQIHRIGSTLLCECVSVCAKEVVLFISFIFLLLDASILFQCSHLINFFSPMHIKVEHIENEIDSSSVQCACNNNAAAAYNTIHHTMRSQLKL